MVIEVSPDPALKGDKENNFKSFKLEIRDLTWKDRCELNDNMSEETEGGKVTPKFSWWGDFVLKYAKINEEELNSYSSAEIIAIARCIITNVNKKKSTK